MKILLISALIVAAALLVNAVPTVNRRHLLRKKALNSLHFPAVREDVRVNDVLQRSKRASCNFRSCDEATSQLSDNTTIVNCVTIFNHIFDGTGISDNDVTTYCIQDHCGENVKEAFDQISACCQDSGLPQNIIITMDESCLKNANGDYCLKDDQATANIFIDPTSDKATEFTSCTSAYQGDSSTCPSECSDILTYITGTLGCCYKAMAGFFSPGPADLATDDLFTTCGKTPPAYCKLRV